MNELIQWPKAKYWTAQWNPVIGCKPISPACENCYAAAWAKRFGQSFEPHSTKQRPPRKGVVFCGNMTDLFGEWVNPYSSSGYILDCIGNGKESTFLWLTKRVVNMTCAIERMARHITNPEARRTLSSHFSGHYFGFTAEKQELYNERFIEFRFGKPSWVNGWLSAEPLLGPIDLGGLSYIAPEDMPFQWVVVGCESGPNRRPCKIEWVESIVDQCLVANVPVFVKQLDIGGRCVTDINKFPAHLRVRQVPWAREGGAK